MVSTTAAAFSTVTPGKAAAASLDDAKSSSASCSNLMIPSMDPERVRLIESHDNIKVRALEPLGFEITGLNMKSDAPPPEPVLQAIEEEMAIRGFVVFRDQGDLDVDESIEACCWFGGRKMHSTHGVHPATPDHNRHIFRLSNDRTHGTLGVGPQWHNDGSFVENPFSHVAMHSIRAPEKGGGTLFAHLGAAFDHLPPEKQEFWERLTSVNSNSGVLHPMVEAHPVTGRKSVWLHLGMTGGVIEKFKDKEGFRLLEDDEMKTLFNDYNDLLNAGFEKGYSHCHDYKQGDLVIFDNRCVAHRASVEAHTPARTQGLRIVHRLTIMAPYGFKPGFDLPQYADIQGRNPFGQGVWLGGGLGYRWDDNIHMQN